MLRRRMLIMLGVVLLIVLVLAGYKAFSIYTMMQGFSVPKPPINVAVATATERPWQSRLPTVGTLTALQGVDLSLEIAGTVKEVQFESGQKVKAGQPILQLDTAVETALLATAQADLGLAQLDYGRGSQLVGSQAISKGEFDRLSAVLQKSRATVNQLKAALERKRILAPFSGTIGIRQVDVGDYVASGTMIATLQDLSSLYVDFFVPEQSVPKIALGQPVQVIVSAYPTQNFPGTISAISPAGVKIQRARAHRIIGAGGDELRHAEALDFTRGGVPGWPLGHAADLGDAGPRHGLFADGDAVTDRLAAIQHVVKIVVVGIDHDRARRFLAMVIDDGAAERRRDRGLDVTDLGQQFLVVRLEIAGVGGFEMRAGSLHASRQHQTTDGENPQFHERRHHLHSKSDSKGKLARQRAESTL